MLLPDFSKGTALKLDCLFHLKSFRQVHDVAYRKGHFMALFIEFYEQGSELAIQFSGG